MSRRFAFTTIAISALVLMAAIAIWLVQAGQDERADLRGSPVTTTTVSAPGSTTTTTTPTPSPSAAPPGPPATLSIPSIGVQSVVVPVGLEPDGEMEVPPAEQAGWYFYGPRPGNADGTAVIAGHVDFGGQPGVFVDLRSLQVGGEVVVTDDVGSTHRFVVTERFQVGKDDLPVEEIFVADGPPGLTLITCGGAFDSGARSYEDNIVVRAVPA